MSAAFMQYWALCYFENLTNSIPDNPQKFQNFGHFRNCTCRLIEKNYMFYVLVVKWSCMLALKFNVSSSIPAEVYNVYVKRRPGLAHLK